MCRRVIFFAWSAAAYVTAVYLSFKAKSKEHEAHSSIKLLWLAICSSIGALPCIYVWSAIASDMRGLLTAICCIMLYYINYICTWFVDDERSRRWAGG